MNNNNVFDCHLDHALYSLRQAHAFTETGSSRAVLLETTIRRLEALKQTRKTPDATGREPQTRAEHENMLNTMLTPEQQARVNPRDWEFLPTTGEFRDRLGLFNQAWHSLPQNDPGMDTALDYLQSGIGAEYLRQTIDEALCQQTQEHCEQVLKQGGMIRARMSTHGMWDWYTLKDITQHNPKNSTPVFIENPTRGEYYPAFIFPDGSVVVCSRYTNRDRMLEDETAFN